MQHIVIKYGGNAIADLAALDAFAQAIAAVAQPTRRLTIVHGGGPQINHWLAKTNTTSHFINGQRYTDEATLNIVEMTLCGQVNKAIVRALQRAGLNGVGISGEDGRLIRVIADSVLGRVGRITHISPQLLTALHDNGFTPVVAPLGCDDNDHAYNINADYSAAHLAAALKAEHFVLMTNVTGILDAAGKCIANINREGITALIDDNTIHGGMLPKVDCARVALDGGCRHVNIIDGTHPENLIALLNHSQTNIGTCITT